MPRDHDAVRALRRGACPPTRRARVHELRPAGAGDGGHPRRRLHALHADPGEGAAAVAGRHATSPGRRRPGTGKTAAFLITVFTRLLATRATGTPAAPRALVIAPTRELVVQIADDARLLGAGDALHHPRRLRRRRLPQAARQPSRQGVDVLIGTPGRLIDYLKQRVYDLRSVEILVIDEADRMFDMGFIADLRFLLPAPARRAPAVDALLGDAQLRRDGARLRVHERRREACR